MGTNNFVFADLSTYDIGGAKAFYRAVFNWSYSNAGDKYHVASLGRKEVSGLYEMPQKFQERQMPSFWMSYIQVEDVDATVKKAKALGGTVELEEVTAIGEIALIRDPLGAGFTVYGGDFLHFRHPGMEHAMVWNELFISDFEKIQPFYEGIFNWTLVPSRPDRYLIKNGEHPHIGAIHVVDNNIKGPKEYWSVYFGVANIEDTIGKVLGNGGKVVYKDEETTVLSDPYDAFFHIKPLSMERGKTAKSLKVGKGKVVLGLVLIVLCLITDWYWIWGLFLGVWVYSDLKSGFTHLFEPVHRKADPFLYWMIVVLWVGLGVYSIATYS